MESHIMCDDLERDINDTAQDVKKAMLSESFELSACLVI